jgi:hypothetical protein
MPLLMDVLYHLTLLSYCIVHQWEEAQVYLTGVSINDHPDDADRGYLWNVGF